MSELYYAEMEPARNESEEAYFKARPQVDTIQNRTLFKAGYERAYQKLWCEPVVYCGKEINGAACFLKVGHEGECDEIPF